MARQADASPYSRHANDWRVSPATTRCTRCAVSAPEVGFWPLVFEGISCSRIWQVARIGTPVVPKSV